MTFTYTGSPSNDSTQGQVDAIRFLSGLTSSSGAVVVQDEEIAFLLSQSGSIYGAAASASEQAAVRYGGMATSKTVGDLSLTYADRAVEYKARATSLRMQSAMRSQVYGGGISVADKYTQETNTDRVAPEFRRDMDDNRRVGSVLGSTGPNG